MGKGKKGKALISLVGFGLGAWGSSLGWFGKGVGWAAGGMYGASLGSTLWTTFNKPKNDLGTGSIQRFDKVMNTASSTATIPVIYGECKWGGNQTYHKIDPEQNTLRKHIVLCEGGIEGIVSVSANDLLIPEMARQPAKTVEQKQFYDTSTQEYIVKDLLQNCFN